MSVRVEDGPKRVRAYVDGVAVVDSTHVRLVWERPNYPTYYFPPADVRTDLLHTTGETRRSPAGGAAEVLDIHVGDRTVTAAAYRSPDSPLVEVRDLITFTWSAIDHWFEEDEEVYVHARSPYTRVDVLPGSRVVRVEIDGVVVAESDHPMFLFETGLPTRYYFAKPEVRLDLLAPDREVDRLPLQGHRSLLVGDHRRHRSRRHRLGLRLPAPGEHPHRRAHLLLQRARRRVRRRRAPGTPENCVFLTCPRL